MNTTTNNSSSTLTKDHGPDTPYRPESGRVTLKLSIQRSV